VTRSAPCAARAMRLDRKTGTTLEFEVHDILPRAAPLHCLADASDPCIETLVATIGPWMPKLKTVHSPKHLQAYVEEHRPDIVLLGRTADMRALESLRQQVRTPKLGVAVFQPPDDALTRFAATLDGAGPQIEIDAIHPAAGSTEVILRLRSLLRRSCPLGLSQRRTIGDITLDEASLTLTINGVAAPIGLNGYRVIAPMFDLPDHVWRAEQIHSIAYGTITRTNVDLVRVALSRARKSLAAKLERDPVRTVRGMGYRLAFLP